MINYMHEIGTLGAILGEEYFETIRDPSRERGCFSLEL